MRLKGFCNQLNDSNEIDCSRCGGRREPRFYVKVPIVKVSKLFGKTRRLVGASYSKPKLEDYSVEDWLMWYDRFDARSWAKMTRQQNRRGKGANVTVAQRAAHFRKFSKRAWAEDAYRFYHPQEEQ